MDWKGPTALAVLFSLATGEFIVHHTIPIHAETGHMDGNNVPREITLRIATTTSSSDSLSFIRAL